MALNWSRERQRQQMQRQGVELANAVLPFFGPLAKRQRRPLPLSKAAARAQAAEAVAAFTGPVSRLPTVVTLRCQCGHVARATIPLGIEHPRFRCSRCGTRQLVGR